MNLQQAGQTGQSRASMNGFGRRRGEKEMGTRFDSKSHSGKANSIKLRAAGGLIGSRLEDESPSRERLVYLTACLIGHHVEAQVADESVFSGIFHATNAEKDFGIVLKMARVTKAGSSRAQKNVSDSGIKPPSKTLIIPAKELVQIIAKNVSVTRDGLANEFQREKQQEIMTDFSISQSRHVEMERELERWVPDEDNPDCPELENIFDGLWNRGWDQFEANETLFGVKSTFNEELYTTKLDRGPQMRELEREALRIAREIEGEDTEDLHLAEERGILRENLDVDEETRYSAVVRGVDDSGCDENEDAFDSLNNETFGNVPSSVASKSFSDLTSGKNDHGTQGLSSLSSVHPGEFLSGSNDHTGQLSSERVPTSVSVFDDESRCTENQLNDQHSASDCAAAMEKPAVRLPLTTFTEETQTSRIEDSHSIPRPKVETSDKGGLSADATAYTPSCVSLKPLEKLSSSGEFSGSGPSSKPQGATEPVNSLARPGSSASSTSDYGNTASASSGPRLSPSSSLGSLSSEKSTLNPHAKEFRLNPNAKSFVPSQTPIRSASPASDISFYYPANAATLPPIHGMPLGIGVGPSFVPHQPVLFGPQAASLQSPQAYFHPNGPHYGQQVILGQPRQVVYMPTYPPDMTYKGRDF